MTSDNVFGSHELTPELLRGASFAEEDGRVDAGEVRVFLDRVASSLDVFLAGDAPSALRAEFDRNAAIATQILDAGQTASEQLRRQAAEEAKRILDEARDATLGLRETVEVEIEQARSQVEEMRGTFIQDLRDLYDRIGASLYRFERASEESQVAPIKEPTRSESSESAPERAPVAGTPGSWSEPEPVHEPDGGAPDLPEGAKPPAWQQLPPEAWQSAPAAAEQPAPDDALEEAPAPAAETLAAEVPAEVAPPADPFEPVVEDEPLAPGEPLVDLRSFGATVEDVDTTPAAPAIDAPGSWLDIGDALPEVAPQAESSAPAGDAGSWLDTPLDPDPEADLPSDPALARDDALAQALIGEPPADAPAGPDAPALAAESPAPIEAPAGGASPDAVAVRQLILDSLASGQTREAVEAYLREHMGLLEPGALVDAALASTEQP